MGEFLVKFEVKDKLGMTIKGPEEMWAGSRTNATKLVEMKYGDTCDVKYANVAPNN